MNTRSKHRILIAAAIAASALATSASWADSTTVTATLLPDNSGGAPGLEPGTDSVDVTFGANPTTEQGGDSYNPSFIGQINWKNTTFDVNAGENSNLELGSPGNTFYTYCIEGTQNVYFGETASWSSGVVPLADAGTSLTIPLPGPSMTQTEAQQVIAFWNLFINQVNLVPTSPTSKLTSQLPDSIPSSDTQTVSSDIFLNQNGLATAFQLGIWEIISDGGTDTASTNFFGTGSFLASSGTDPSFDADILAQANSWLSTLYSTNLNTVAQNYTLYALTDDTYQDQIFAVPNVGSPAVPLPPAIATGLTGLGLLGLLAGLRFRRRLA